MSSNYSHGIDIVSIKRISSAIKRGGAGFLDRVYAETEQSYCQNRARRYEHFAARFAAKEAFVKALGDRAHCVALNDVVVDNLPSGKPFFKLTPAVLKKAGLTAKTTIELSLSHEREFAVASVIIVRRG